jgi:hypothetical protein
MYIIHNAKSEIGRLYFEKGKNNSEFLNIKYKEE